MDSASNPSIFPGLSAADTRNADDALDLAGRESAWRSLFSFSAYRVLVAVILLVVLTSFNRQLVIGAALPGFALSLLITYFSVGLGLVVLVLSRAPRLEIQPTLNVLVDVTFITLITYASGGVRSGWGILLLVTLAGTGLISRGRLAMFHAAVAALAILLEQMLQVLWNEASISEFVQSGLLAGSYFAIAALASSMANFVRGAEEVAKARGVDLANLAQINELVIRDIQDGFVVVDADGVVRQSNAQSAALIKGLAFASGRRLDEVAPAVAKALEEWRVNPARIFPMSHEQSTNRDYQLRFVAAGKAATIIFIEDASRIRSQAQQMKLVALGRLTASIAHEIRNPLSSINHAAELLQEDADRSPADARLLTIIRDNAHRLDRMVQEVLYLNRRDRAQPEAIDVGAYLFDFVREFCANEKVAEGIIHIDIAARRRAWFDRSHLDQILWNLSRNAVRHGTASPGAVQVRFAESRQSNSRLVIEVTDDGPGVAPDALAHLFEPFFTTDAHGTGLGLYIARELAEVNGAALDYALDSANGNAGRGACFRLTVRVAEMPIEDAASKSNVADTLRPAGLTE